MPRWILEAVVVCWLAPAAFAQPPASGQVRGRVTDDSGGVLPGVTVQLRLVPDGLPSETVTAAMGDYASTAWRRDAISSPSR